ncbi:hypothetical protein HBN71_21545 [Pseudomonas lundensis]|uniref:hypothetical protein n=1 Tax=Pseudomonas TaxID=286 RepID=UPI0006427FDE|nr:MULTISPECIES: hypothetical protein [Pseudomonas]NNA13730.1 hypothetical protein [Pseudomonas lundensis]
MSNVIAQLADMVPSDDLLAQIDIAEVYEKFHHTFKQLDDFKKIRDEHERRGFLGRMFNRSELKDAQLDAQEVQAEFSKTLAQLMVISSLQSQQLTKQQELIQQQQKDLEAKALELARQNGRLEQHQAVIRDQSNKLRIYVTDLLDVQGLTGEHGEMLIQIAQEVMTTRDSLLADFDRRMEATRDLLENQHELSRQLQESHATRAKQQLAELRSEMDLRLEDLQQKLQQQILSRIEAQRVDEEQQVARLRATLDMQGQIQRALRTELEENKVIHTATLEALRSEQQASEARLSWMLRKQLAGLCGLALACALGIGGVYQLGRSVTAVVPPVTETHSSASN